MWLSSSRDCMLPEYSSVSQELRVCRSTCLYGNNEKLWNMKSCLKHLRCRKWISLWFHAIDAVMSRQEMSLVTKRKLSVNVIRCWSSRITLSKTYSDLLHHCIFISPSDQETFVIILSELLPYMEILPLAFLCEEMIIPVETETACTQIKDGQKSGVV